MYGRCNNAGYAPAYGRMSHRGFGGYYRRPKYNVPVNISETEGAYEVSVYAVGFDKEHIKLSIVDEALYITGTREVGDPAPQFIKQEFTVKHF